jgi:hypothetical protein
MKGMKWHEIKINENDHIEIRSQFFDNDYLKPTSGAIMTTLPAAGSTVCTAATITSLSPLFTLSVNAGRAESENEIEKRREEMRRKNLI